MILMVYFVAIKKRNHISEIIRNKLNFNRVSIFLPTSKIFSPESKKISKQITFPLYIV